MKSCSFVCSLVKSQALIAVALVCSGSLLIAANPASGVDASYTANDQAQSAASTSDVIATATKAGGFNTLLAALEAAELTSALQGPGPFTVFAPTDAAFAKLPAGTVDSLLKPENKGKLSAILTYHVISGKVPSSALATTPAGETLNGQRIYFKNTDSKWFAENAMIVKTDIACSNGVIHVIDAVIIPSTDTIAAVATSAGKFNTLLAAAKAAGLVDALTGSKPLTVLAPTDEAFAKLPAGTVEMLLKPENKDKLTAILTYHIIAGRVYSNQALQAKQGKTLQGGTVEFAMRDGGVYANNAKVIGADVDTANGVIHIVDTVLMPPAK